MEDSNEVVAFIPRGDEQLFLQEMMHRVSNEFSSAVSIISVRAARSPHPEVKIALNEAINLLISFASVHRALRLPAGNMIVDASVYLRKLCSAISNAKLRPSGIQLILSDVEPLLLRADRCWTLGLIVSELITNASRHAFGITKGTIRIELLNSRSCIKCCVSDNGSVRDVVRPGNGLKIIQSLARGLGGSVDHQFGPNGTVSLITLPNDEPQYSNASRANA
jgi:two-component sensor histidine kinase